MIKRCLLAILIGLHSLLIGCANLPGRETDHSAGPHKIDITFIEFYEQETVRLTANGIVLVNQKLPPIDARFGFVMGTTVELEGECSCVFHLVAPTLDVKRTIKIDSEDIGVVIDPSHAPYIIETTPENPLMLE